MAWKVVLPCVGWRARAVRGFPEDGRDLFRTTTRPVKEGADAMKRERGGARRRALTMAAMMWMWPMAQARPAMGVSGGSEGTAAIGQSIPEIHGTSLAGATVELPKMLSGKVGVLVIGFSRESRDPVAEWGRRLATEYRESPAVLYYEMPMLAEVPRMLRGMVVRSMRKEVPGRAQERFVPLLNDEVRWKDLAGYEKGDEAYVVVVDGSGRVRGREHGPETEAAFAEVKNLVQSAAAVAGQP